MPMVASPGGRTAGSPGAGRCFAPCSSCLETCFRTNRVRAALVNIYGFRPLVPELALLSPYEFVQYWMALPVKQPSDYDDETFADWTREGKTELRKGSFQDGKKKCKAGVHFIVIKPTDQSYMTFPQEPVAVYGQLRHLWILRRRRRPIVPVLEGVPLPREGRSKRENGKYCSVFFRPWTLLDNTLTTDTWPDVAADVPHLRNLGVVRETEDVREAKERVLETELDQSLAHMAAAATNNKRIQDVLLQKPSVVPERSDHFEKTWA